jgi:hypothetical protein
MASTSSALDQTVGGLQNTSVILSGINKSTGLTSTTMAETKISAGYVFGRLNLKMHVCMITRRRIMIYAICGIRIKRHRSAGRQQSEESMISWPAPYIDRVCMITCVQKNNFN